MEDRIASDKAMAHRLEEHADRMEADGYDQAAAVMREKARGYRANAIVMTWELTGLRDAGEVEHEWQPKSVNQGAQPKLH